MARPPSCIERLVQEVQANGPPREARRGVVALLAVGGGAVVANLYYAQPLLPRMAESLHSSEEAMGGVAMATQLGYGLGMLGLVPLGDRLERRRLIVAMTALAGLAVLGVAVAPTIEALLVLSVLLGLASMVPQLIVPYAATIAPAHARGRVVGTVMAGFLVGILLSRSVSGFVGGAFGWRAVYVLAAGVMGALALVLAFRLPAQRPEAPVPLGELYASLARIVRDEPILRTHALLGAMSFGAFSVFWSTLAFHLASLPGHYGSGVVGAYGLVGVAGAMAAPVVGRFADRHDPRIVNLGALLVLLASFVVFAAAGGSLVALVVGVVLLDVGAQSNHISNQARIFALAPALRSRLNTVYMTSFFAGGAAGSYLGVLAWTRAGWVGACAVGAAMTLVAVAALLLSAVRQRRGLVIFSR
jgi:predicted MFS family arabinose efflux permease